MKSCITSSLQLALFALICICCIVVSECRVSPELQVSLKHGGGVTGKYMTSSEGRGIRAFFGVPFAEPPIGELRFKSPVPKFPWAGFINASVDNKGCIQEWGIGEKALIVGEEDCLYLNVYAPLEPKTSKPLPVMVFFHGGGFMMGSCGGPFYTPEYLLDHDVIFVSGNYRLGPLGFLSLGSSEIPGNFGLKDQSLLLQWVQEHIHSFGGDPNQVTIFGESAGSASVAYHLTSPKSKGKFHKAILQSGNSYAPWSFDYLGNNLKNAIIFGNQLNCPLTEEKTSFKSFVNCLHGKSAREIQSASGKISDLVVDPYYLFLPTIEEGPDAFISERPTEIRSSHGLNIPILIGSNSQEGVIKSGAAYSSDVKWERINSNLDKYINDLSTVRAPSVEVDEQRKQMLKEFYHFENGRIERENVHNATDFFSDAYFTSPLDDFLVNRLESNNNSAETFVYLFAHRGAASLTDLFPMMIDFPDININLGVSHMDDLFYLFPIGENVAFNIIPTPLDRKVQRTLTQMWVNFATNGRPTSSESPVDWQPTNGFPLNYLRIGNYGAPEKDLIDMEEGFLEERVSFWRNLKAMMAQKQKGETRNVKGEL